MREMNAKKVIITIVDGTVFRGSINIGNSRRISDYLRKHESLFVLFDATIGDSTEKEVFFLNADHVLWVKPDEEAERMASEDILHMAIENEAELD